jgi:hypothetical protein
VTFPLRAEASITIRAATSSGVVKAACGETADAGDDALAGPLHVDAAGLGHRRGHA